jgi:glutamyl-tRNA reductase
MFALAELDQMAPETHGGSMTGGLSEHQKLAMIGVSYRTASVALREKFAIGPERLPHVLRTIAEHPAVHEVFILSTCNRTELYAVITESEDWRAQLRYLLLAHSHASADEVEDCFYWHAGEDVARHLFRVSAGLDSMVLGEAEIVNQLKQAANTARGTGMAGTILQRLNEKALAAQKRARTQACYDCGLSVASLAAAACKRAFDDLSTVSVMMLGAGETAELTLHYLVSKGVRRVSVANRTVSRAEQLVRLTGGTALSLTAMPGRLADVDMVICCTGSPDPVLTHAMLVDMMTGRPDRPLLVVDIAVPRDVEPDVALIPGVKLINIDNLHGAAIESLEQRQAKLIAADEIISTEAREFGKWLSCRRAIAVVADLQQQIEALRGQIVETITGQLQLDTCDCLDVIDAQTRALVRGILKESLCAMQNFTGSGDATHQMALVRRMLDQDLEPGRGV